jgi:hypothetical protein
VLPPTDDQNDRIAAPLDRAGTRALADNAADSLGVDPTNPSDPAVSLPDLPLRGSEA